MKVTRDVIYDLLPGYFSGEISPDTRALVDEFLQQDPEFARMMQRFREVFRETRPSNATPDPGTAVMDPGSREVFERARGVLHKRSELRGYVIAFGLAALLVFLLAVMRGDVGPWFIAGAFALTSAISAYQLRQLRRSVPAGRSH